jgi:hypothetical protein
MGHRPDGHDRQMDGSSDVDVSYSLQASQLGPYTE